MYFYSIDIKKSMASCASEEGEDHDSDLIFLEQTIRADHLRIVLHLRTINIKTIERATQVMRIPNKENAKQVIYSINGAS